MGRKKISISKILINCFPFAAILIKIEFPCHYKLSLSRAINWLTYSYRALRTREAGITERKVKSPRCFAIFRHSFTIVRFALLLKLSRLLTTLSFIMKLFKAVLRQCRVFPLTDWTLKRVLGGCMYTWNRVKKNHFKNLNAYNQA